MPKRGALALREAALAKRQARLSAAQRDRLEALMQGEAPSAATTIPRRPERGLAPLSFAQQRIWFLHQLEPDSYAYNMPTAVRLMGRLDVTALEQSLNEIVRRHETLRTTFAVVERRPVQVIASTLEIALPVIDLIELPEPEREVKIRQLAVAEAQRPFDLMRGPLLRAILLWQSAQEHVLLLTMHHIVSDGWSIGVSVRELTLLYRAFTAGEPSPLPELPIQYADFAVWQRQWLQGQVLETQLAYWKRQLGDHLPVLELPTDRLRPSVHTFHGATRSFALSPAVSEALKALCQQEDVTLFMALLAAFNVLLHRYTGQTDIVVGTPVANRTWPETEDLIGFFVNTLVLRTDLAGNPTFRDLVGRVREITLGAFARQDLPFEKLVEELQPERNLSQTPLFQIMFVLQNASTSPFELPGLTLRLLEIERETAQFDLTLALVDTPQGVKGIAGYNTDLFEEETIARLLVHWQELVVGIAAEPERRIADLPMLTDAERRQVLAEWNDTQAEYPRGQCLPELFEAQVKRTPDAVAVTLEEQHVSYRELNRRANQLARRLRAMGVKQETVVGLGVDRSPETVMALLGILKAGGAYLPLDAAYAAERLSFMCEDSQAQILLTRVHLLESFAFIARQSSFRVVCLDRDWESIDCESVENLESGASANHLAYIIYTSGSTGRPKGVMVEHRGLGNLAEAQGQAFEVDAESRVLQFASLSFDASVSEVVKTLLAGATLCLGRSESLRPGIELIELLRRQAITTATLPPSVLGALPSQDLGLRTIISAGEACTSEIVRRWAARRRFVNAYGPTEATVCATLGECEAEGQRPTIGRPITNVQVYLLDESGQPVPVGVPGEVYIGGVGLARGYLNRPELTAGAFVPNPVSGEPGARLYRAGDWARYRPDGNIEFLGRMDQQVKVRGFRIELGEIEAVLGHHPAVREAVVVARQDTPGDKRLVAYVSPETVPAAGMSELRGWAKERLPEYMLPAAWVMMGTLPRTSSGKIDRLALPAPQGARPELAAAYVAPRNAVEEWLAGIWRQVLGLEQVGVYDNFFELGGDSIQGAVLISQLQEQLGEYVYVVALFDAPTVAGLAAYLGEHYSEALAKRLGLETRPTATASVKRITAARVAELRRLIAPLPRLLEPPAAKNRRAIFVLSPPRSGSTLLRVILGGHPQLFAPPELELLSFNTLQERASALSGRYSFWQEGAVRAIMQIRQCSAEEAQRLVRECKDRGLSTLTFYRIMQDWMGDRLLVDKTPSYALDVEILRRAEVYFEGALYIHLLRHPCGMIRSFEEAKTDQVFFRPEHTFTRRELAELIWLVSQENILEFLQEVPAERQMRVRFEDLVHQPRETVEELCRFLGLAFHPDMLEPYKEKQARMSDGIHPLSKMLGDVKFHEHRGIEAEVAERWKEHYADDLGEMTWQMAEGLGYERPAGPRAKKVIRAEQGVVTGRVPLAPIQHWFFERELLDIDHFNLAILLQVPGELKAERLEAAVAEAMKQHDALRLRFRPGKGGWEQWNAGLDVPVPFALVDVMALVEGERRKAIDAAVDQLQRSLDLKNGPVLRVALFKVGKAEPSCLLIIVHHLVMDRVSWRYLLDDLQAAYEQIERGETVRLPLKTTSFKEWAERLEEHARSVAVRQELSYWTSESRRQVRRLPVDYKERRGANTVGSTQTVEIALGEKETATLLRQVPKAYHTQINDVLLAALVQTMAKWTGGQSVLVDVEGHGREKLFEEIDVSRTVGWFTVLYPVWLGIERVRDPREMLEQVKGQLQQIPSRGMGYGLLRYLRQEQQVTEQLEAMPQAEVVFNYMGQFGRRASGSTGWGIALDPIGRLRSPRGMRRYLLEINAGVTRGQLQLAWSYSENLHRRSTIEDLAQDYVKALCSLIDHCTIQVEKGYESWEPSPTISREPADISSVLVCMQAGHLSIKPLFLVHPVGGDVFCYADLVRHLGPAQPVYGFRAQGLDGRQPPYVRVEVMARRYIESLRTVQPEGPYLLGGWSMGGAVALEMAQQLLSQGQRVDLLALVDSPAPTGTPGPEPDEALLVGRFAVDLGLAPQQVMAWNWERLMPLELDEQLTYVLEQARQAHVAPPDVGLAQVRRLFHVFESNAEAMRRYIARVYAGQIALFKAGERSEEQASSEDLGWGALAAGDLKVYTVPGNHFTVMREPNVRVLAGQLGRHLLDLTP